MTPQTILLTGAGTGIGRDTAFMLARRGHRVIATTQTDLQSELLLADAKKEGFALESFVLDITNEQDRKRIAAIAPQVLIANAAIGETGPLAEIPLERMRALWETNVLGTIACVQQAARSMIALRTGRIIITSSIAGRLVVPFMGPYHMTKFALEAAGDALRLELKPFGVHVSLVEPGLILTGFNERMAETKYAWLRENSPYGRYLPGMRKHDASLPAGSHPTDAVVRAMRHAVESRSPRSRYVAPSSYRLTLFAERFLPTFLKDWTVGSYGGLSGKK